jgi:pimeloyl-ACP methyl ester carboxylesterase
LIKQVKWSRIGEFARDLFDHEGQLNAAYRLACLVNAFRRESPHARIIFVGHSTGSRVMLAAAEALPPGSIERIFLLSSTVSCGYDLRRALLASRYGIDNYYSEYDNKLESLEDKLGTSDGKRSPMAGRVGFRPPFPPNHPAAAPYCNLRQIKWNEDRGNGNGLGGHYTWTHRTFIRYQLLPQFFQAPVAPRLGHGH